MRRWILLALAITLVFTVAVSPAAYAQRSTPTVTPTAESGVDAAATATPADDVATPGASDDDMTSTLGMTDPVPEASGTIRQSFDLLGADVVNSAGDDLGRLDNLLVIPSSGYIPFALIASGGFFGLGEKLVPVPFSALQYDPEREVFILDVDSETLQDAPSLGRYASPNTRELLRNTELRAFWSQFDLGAGQVLPEITATPDTGVTEPMTRTLPSETTTGTPTVTLEADADATGTPTLETATRAATATLEADMTATGTPTPAATEIVTDTETLTDTVTVDVTPVVTDVVTDTMESDTPATGLVQVGSFGEQSLRSLGMAGQGEEDLVRLTELGDFSIVARWSDLGLADDERDETGVATPEATTMPELDTDATVTPEATDVLTDTTGVDVTPMATDAITGTETMTDTITATETVTDTETVTETATVVSPDVSPDLDTDLDLDEQKEIIGQVQDLLIDVEAGRVLYVLASVDRIRLNALFGPLDAGLVTEGTVTETVPGATATPMLTVTPEVDTTDVITDTGTITDTTDITETTPITPTIPMTDTGVVTDTSAITETTPVVPPIVELELMVIPWQALDVNLLDSELLLRFPVKVLSEAPSAGEFDLFDFREAGWDNELRTFWSRTLAEIPSVSIEETPELVVTPEAVVTLPPPSGRNVATDTGVVMQVREVLGTNVKDTLGERLGTLTDLVFGSNDGAVYYGIVTYGGLLGLGSRHVGVPWSAFRFDPANEDFVLDTNRDALDNAPVLGQGAEPFGTPGWDAEIRDYWGNPIIETPATTGGLDDDSGVAATGELTATGAITDTNVITGTEVVTGTAPTEAIDVPDTDTPAVGQLLRAERIIGRNIAGAAGDDLGEVSDLLMNLDNGQLLYALVSYGGFLGIGETDVVVPWTSLGLELTEGAPNLSLNTDKATLDNAPQFDLGSLPEAVSAGWDANVRSYWERITDQ